MELKTFKADVFSESRLKEINSAQVKPSYKKIFDNVHLVDTAGFVPLDVRIKQFLVSGEQAKLSSEMFDSDDWRYMFEHINDNQLEVGDDIEDVNRKLSIVIARQQEILARKFGENPEVIAHDKTSDEKRSDKEASAGSAEASEQKA